MTAGPDTLPSLRLYNTLGRREEEFRPLHPDRVLMYTCGPTVWHFTHIGNMRSFLTADLLRRVLEYNGYIVTHAKNITDVGHLRDEVAESGADRIEAAARESGKTPVEIIDFYTGHYLRDEERMNLLEPAFRPRATEYVAQMIALAARLIEAGFAYSVGGNVYFDVSTYAAYGQLSGNRQEELMAGQRVEIEPDKRSPADFALWKKGDPARFMNWESPWGKYGFPGWHIECSVMASELLAEQIDIHTGGIDNLFPHHEDERAQSEAATGQQFVRYWIHTAHLLAGDEKMSRSLGNFSTVANLIEHGIDPLAFRYFLMQGHYRKKLSWTWEALEAAQSGLDRIWQQVAELAQEAQEKPESGDRAGADEIRTRFLESVNDDLGLPRALAVLQEVFDSVLSPATKIELIHDMDRVFGLRLLQTAEDLLDLSLAQRNLLDQRAAARSGRDFALSDRLRNELLEMGVSVRDTPAGQRWVRSREVSGSARE